MNISRTTVLEAISSLEGHNSNMKGIADSGDTGNWLAEDEPTYITAQATVAKLRAALGLAATAQPAPQALTKATP